MAKHTPERVMPGIKFTRQHKNGGNMRIDITLNPPENAECSLS
jgi:hypothetical protein